MTSGNFGRHVAADGKMKHTATIDRASNSRPHVAVLMTCHNRRDVTVRCLASLREAANQAAEQVTVQVFLVDDGCTDGTAEALAKEFPEVFVIEGTGSLYWCGGMRLAWRAAASKGGFDAYLWLNDDVTLFPDALAVLMSTQQDVVRKTGRSGIIVGSTRNHTDYSTTYGDMGPAGVVPPGDSPRVIHSFNGNIVLVPDNVYRVVGGLSRAYRHGFGDIDYACRAGRAGIPMWLAPGHLGACMMDKISRWERADMPLWQRLIAMHQPTGCPPWEVVVLLMRRGNWLFPCTVAKLYWRALFPKTGRVSTPGLARS
jgi:GT2 family glycosyltransferase